ncbi:MAG: rhodanese-like domain-containing protein [Chloroflexi bacterium]|nr:rhodanese-like domain-containing protein [Chloroflexota bacterium]
MVITLITIVACTSSAQPEDVEPVPVTQPVVEVVLPLEITVEEAYLKYQEGVFFLDVREQEEWDAFHIPETTLIPLSELPDRLSELPRDRQIVVVCRSGNRSQLGRDTLLQAGFTNVTSMTGGVTEWSSAGYPIEGTRP